MLRRTRRTLEHWTPDVDEYSQWLTERAAEGWDPEYPWSPTQVPINGQDVWVVALIDTESFARGLGYRKPWGAGL